MNRLRVLGGSLDLTITGGRIETIAVGGRSPVQTGDGAVLDATGCAVLPGFVDLQVNGADGVDLTTTPDRLATVARTLPSMGVTSFLATIISASPDETAHAVDVIARLAAEPNSRTTGARALGVHLEGPFIAPQRRGAHPLANVRLPSRHEARGWSAAAGVAMVTLAPELAGANELVRDLSDRGVVVCIGHTAAGTDDVERAAEWGATGATHLFNAMGPMSARNPGTAGAVMMHPTLIAGLIADGIHVHPTMIALAWEVMGSRRIALVTDAMAALGLGHGAHQIGGTAVVVDETGARTADGVLAGSVLGMDAAVRNLRTFTGCSLADASVAASATPALLLGRTDIGTLRAGALADVVVIDERGEVAATVVAGDVVFDPHGRLTTTTMTTTTTTTTISSPASATNGASWKS